MSDVLSHVPGACALCGVDAFVCGRVDLESMTVIVACAACYHGVRVRVIHLEGNVYRVDQVLRHVEVSVIVK